MKNKFVHPYIPNSVPEVKAKMLEEIGVSSIEELYSDIPERLRFRDRMKLPEALPSELALKQHMHAILSRNKNVHEYDSFLGGGVANHFVPAICDEINGRSEFLTAYAGEPYEDHGRFQALFEYQSLMGELLDFEVVNVPTYDWAQAASTSIRMAQRITQKDEILVSELIGPDRRSAIENYCKKAMKITPVRHDRTSGLIDLDDLRSKLNDNTAGIYFENPSYVGVIEHRGEEISQFVHKAGGLSIVGVDPISLGILKPPAQYGADIACGDIQTLGNHLHYGGCLGGFIATRDEEKFVMEYPSRLFGITKTEMEGEWGFDDVAYNRTSFGVREKGKEFVGTANALYAITSAVYLSLMGPDGMSEIGRHLIQKSLYAKKKLEALAGTELKFSSASFKEFVVDFSNTGKRVKDINAALLNRKIFGGIDLSQSFPWMGNCALFCFTEMNTQAQIDRLVSTLEEILA
ncbi:MAG: aminomethyl-transferring glycine dehydrogenase subunit GcvPA [Cytophagales bacterium]|nr:aminomethyl-transferring glycine dehydrogenase subunit GcvPA [Cytophagales bacterium]